MYTPGSGFTNSDNLTYSVCDAVANPTTTTTAAPTTTTTTIPPAEKKVAAVTAPPGTTLRCSTATVTISAIVVQAVTTTTVATLPRTGSSSTPLAFLGGGMCVLGLAALGASRRRPLAS